MVLNLFHLCIQLYNLSEIYLKVLYLRVMILNLFHFYLELCNLSEIYVIVKNVKEVKVYQI